MRRPGVLAALVLGAVVLRATGAHAADAPFTMTPTRTTSGGTVHLASVTPCPPVDDPSYDAIVVRAQIYKWNGRGFWTSARPVNADRSWGWDMAIPTGNPPGRYIVEVTCEEGTSLPNGDTTERDTYYGYDVQQLVLQPPAGTDEAVARIAGTDRIATAVAASVDATQAGKASGAVIARADAYADSLAGTPLAAAVRGPLLLTGSASLDSRVEQELARAIDPAERSFLPVYLLGGTSALSPTVEARLKDLGYQVERIGGLTRYGTATRIAGLWDDVSRIFLADGTDWHDGLVAGAAARSDFLRTGDTTVVLLTNGRAMPDESAAIIRDHPEAPRFAIGAPAAAADPAATPLVGSGPVETAVKVATTMFPGPVVVGVASQGSFADALAGGTHAALKGGPLLFTDVGSVPAATDRYLRSNAGALVAGWAYGGTAAVAEPTRRALQERINGR